MVIDIGTFTGLSALALKQELPQDSRVITFDIVYAWGVLHHTGLMWESLGNAATLVRPGGRLVIAIYNDQGEVSRMWTAIKRLYNLLPRPGKFGIVLGVGAFFRAWGATDVAGARDVEPPANSRNDVRTDISSERLQMN